MIQGALFTLIYILLLALTLRAVKLLIFGRLWLVYISTTVCYVCRLMLDVTTVYYDWSAYEEGDGVHAWLVYVFRLLNSTSDRVRNMVLIFFLFQVQEVKIKIASESPHMLQDKQHQARRQYLQAMLITGFSNLIILLSYAILLSPASSDIVAQHTKLVKVLRITCLALRAILIIIYLLISYFMVIKNYQFYVRKQEEKRAILDSESRTCIERHFLALIIIAIVFGLLDGAEGMYKESLPLIQPDDRIKVAILLVQNGFYVATNFINFAASLCYLYLGYKLGEKRLEIIRDSIKYAKHYDMPQSLVEAGGGRKDYNTESLKALLQGKEKRSTSINDKQANQMLADGTQGVMEPSRTSKKVHVSQTQENQDNPQNTMQDSKQQYNPLQQVAATDPSKALEREKRLASLYKVKNKKDSFMHSEDSRGSEFTQKESMFFQYYIARFMD
ncbi:hypothetical protein FGO68_gene3583 [Halteria grandinella]|uniref:Uncharacterized protein n=1 Tax=Halteria grandinella TaxID=5974 RepID=A0A8J8NQP0_HALGN|nr:hypothetical protein FGO68_gene3583 [Halteria grandinella]